MNCLDWLLWWLFKAALATIPLFAAAGLTGAIEEELEELKESADPRERREHLVWVLAYAFFLFLAWLNLFYVILS